MSNAANGNQSPEFASLLGYLQDHHRHETASMWKAVAASELGPQDREQAARLDPHVRAYLSGQIERHEYEERLLAVTIPSVGGPAPAAPVPVAPIPVPQPPPIPE
jgi:hypothetical protein